MNLVSVSLSVCVAPSPNFFLFILLAPSLSLSLLWHWPRVTLSFPCQNPLHTHTHTQWLFKKKFLFHVCHLFCFAVCPPHSQISERLFISLPTLSLHPFLHLLSPFSISLSLPLSFYVISCPSCSIISLSEVVLTSTIQLHIHWWTDRWTDRESHRLGGSLLKWCISFFSLVLLPKLSLTENPAQISDTWKMF